MPLLSRKRRKLLLAAASLFLPGAVGVITTAVVPAVEEGKGCTKMIYMKTTPRLIVHGANFNEHTELLFDPPLQMGTDFRLTVINSTLMSVTKAFSYDDPALWAAEPGPLKVVAINTGSGLVHLKPEEGGVLVAIVQADLEHHGISVTSHESQRVYQSARQIKVLGTGFEDDIKARFANGIRGQGTNFTITTDTLYPGEFMLNLAEGSTWIKDPNSLPKSLVMLAVDAGRGWVPLGPSAAKPGRKVATVFEDPGIDASDMEINRNTRELLITGTGFTKHVPVLQFDLPLNSDEIVVDVVNRTTIRMSLKTISAGWTVVENLGGPLNIKGIDTGAGMVVFDSPVTVATFAPLFTASEKSAA